MAVAVVPARGRQGEANEPFWRRHMRLTNDAYYTPGWLARIIVRDVLSPWLRGTPRVLEPSAGDGVFVRAVREQCPGATITACDLEPLALPDADAHVSGSFLTTDAGMHDIVVGNPPYSLAESFVRRSLEVAPVVCYLLRLGFLASAQRAPLYACHQPAGVWVSSRRPAFTGGGTDSADYCVVLWAPRWSPGPTELRWLPLT
jgi:hypothetical protein